MTTPVSRDQIAVLRTEPRPFGLAAARWLALLATAEAYHDEHDRAERLAAEVDSPTYLRLAQIAAADRDAARADLAALVADLRALHYTWVNPDDHEPYCAECGEEPPCKTVALLDRHAPEEGCGHPDGWQYADGTCRCHGKRSTVIAPEEGS